MKKIHESTLINSEGTDPQTPFGATWRERVCAVRGFRVRTQPATHGHPGIVDVANLFELVVTNVTCFSSGDGNNFFLLLPGEMVQHVDVYSSVRFSESVKIGLIHAIRFCTTHRVSVWFGTCIGAYTRLSAPEGEYIQALFGARSGVGCTRLGVVFSSLALAPIATSGKNDASTMIRVDDSPQRLSFSVHCDSPKAFSVRVDEYIHDLMVLSHGQYEAMTELRPSYGRSGEHWFVLVKNEHVTAVGMRTQHKRLVSMCFRTNFRTSVWYGQRAIGEVKWLTSPPRAFICGFMLEGIGFTTCSRVTGVAAVYKAKDANVKVEAATTAKSA